jgi:hypothetical protein
LRHWPPGTDSSTVRAVFFCSGAPPQPTAALPNTSTLATAANSNRAQPTLPLFRSPPQTCGSRSLAHRICIVVQPGATQTDT